MLEPGGPVTGACNRARTNLICSFYLRVTERKVISADVRLRDILPVAETPSSKGKKP